MFDGKPVMQFAANLLQKSIAGMSVLNRNVRLLEVLSQAL